MTPAFIGGDALCNFSNVQKIANYTRGNNFWKPVGKRGGQERAERLKTFLWSGIPALRVIEMDRPFCIEAVGKIVGVLRQGGKDAGGGESG
jgi:hypothetical protein